MDRVHNKIQNLIFNLIYASLVFSLAYMFSIGMKLDLNIVLKILMVLSGSVLVKFFLLNPLVLYGLLVLGLIGTFIVHRYVTNVFTPIFDRIVYLFGNIINNLQGKENIEPDNLLIFWGILIVLVSLFTAFILFKGKNIYLMLPVYMGIFILYWYNFYDEAYVTLSVFILSFVILIGLKKYSRLKL